MIKGYIIKKYNAAGRLVEKRITFDGTWEEVKRTLKHEFTEGVVRLTLTCQKGAGFETKAFVRKEPKDG